MLAFRVLGIPELQRMKREAVRSWASSWDTRIAEIADRAGVDIVSVGDSVGQLWGQAPEEVSLEEMMLLCKAVRRGVALRRGRPTFPRTSKTLRRRCACRSAAPRW